MKFLTIVGTPILAGYLSSTAVLKFMFTSYWVHFAQFCFQFVAVSSIFDPWSRPMTYLICQLRTFYCIQV